MDCFAGCSTGTLKAINFTDSAVTNLLPSSISAIGDLKPKEHGITAVCFSDKDQTEVLACRLNRELCLYNSLTGSFSTLFNVEGGSGIVKSIQVTSDQKIITAVESGELSVWNSKGELLTSTGTEDEKKKEMNAGANLECMQLAPNNDNLMATGGRENPLKLWDMERGEPTFTAKNVRPDMLELRVPVWVTNVRFLGKGDGNSIVTTTGKAQIRLYDPRAQRRPVRELEWMDEPLQALSTCCRENHVLVGNRRAELGLFDLRTKIGLASKYKGFAGSIRSIDAHPTEPHFVSCGIDRFAVVHDLNSKRVIKKIFCKVPLTSVLLKNENSLLDKTTKEEKTDRPDEQMDSASDDGDEDDFDEDDDEEDEGGF